MIKKGTKNKNTLSEDTITISKKVPFAAAATAATAGIFY